jgi:hypothetical protein
MKALPTSSRRKDRALPASGDMPGCRERRVPGGLHGWSRAKMDVPGTVGVCDPVVAWEGCGGGDASGDVDWKSQPSARATPAPAGHRIRLSPTMRRRCIAPLVGQRIDW